MTAEGFVLAAAAVMGLSGAPACLDRNPRRAALLSLALVCIAAGLGFVAALLGLTGTASRELLLPWSIPGGALRFRLDPLSAFFLIPVFTIAVASSIHGLGYWSQEDRGRAGTQVRIFTGIACAGMIVLLAARNSLLFLFGWEMMAIAAFFMVGVEDHLEATRRSAWVYLVTAHVGVLALIGLFGLMARWQGSLDWVIPGRHPAGFLPSLVILVLALVGFGLKAGIMPLHLWLPGAHANAPSHVSAIMSGVVIKMGVYGLLRLLTFYPQPPAWWGVTLLVLGSISAVAGIVSSNAQSDLKRLLAYSSIENIGIIMMGVGLAALGMSLGRPSWVALGMAGALLHVLNHSLFKGTLFLCAGAVVHATGTREMDRLGGLGHRMPATALVFAIASASICALPPLNGFVSEWFVYRGLFEAASPGSPISPVGPMVAIVALSATGALALAGFVRAFGTVFLGAPRTPAAGQAHEATPSMLVGMWMTAWGCILVGALPVLLLPVLTPVLRLWTPGLAAGRVLQPGWVSIMAILLWLAVAAGAALAWHWKVRGIAPPPGEREETWGCGYLFPSARMQYTATSFSQLLVSVFEWLVRPEQRRPVLAAPLPPATCYAERTPESVLEGLASPAFRGGAERLTRLRWLQQGSVHVYLSYILVAVVLGTAWAALRYWVGAR